MRLVLQLAFEQQRLGQLVGLAMQLELGQPFVEQLIELDVELLVVAQLQLVVRLVLVELELH